ncbi:MAG: NAD(P)H-hydrate dehydratase [Clostridia bacterium]|nr:NAD(P)H-hydrate dehydratase [Clostridia bacterium]
MIEVLSVKNMRESDAHTIAGGVPGRELMYRAGVGILESVSWKEPVAIVCGSGNNGGDGYVLATLLHERGVSCALFSLSDRFSEDGRYYSDLCTERGIPRVTCGADTDFSGYRTVVDCIFGTGFRGDAEGLARSVIEAINKAGEMGAYVVSVDINSGMNGDNGRCAVAVRSDLTVSIGGCKSGHFLGSAKDYIKRLVNCDIGILPIEKPYGLYEASDVKAALGVRKNDSNKSTYGYVALVGGSEYYSGAIRLSSLAESAMRSGAGVTTVAAPKSLSHVILPAILESTFFPLSEENGFFKFDSDEFDRLTRRVKVVAFGMGIGLSDEAERAVSYLLTQYTGRLVLDADGLNALAKLPRQLLCESAATVVLTPHPLEFARLAGLTVDEVLNDPIGRARGYARETGAIVLLKGSTTVVTDGEEVILVDRGCAGMATAGSGDVLSGILAALLGYVSDPLSAVASAAYLNGRAGELAEAENGTIPMTAGDTARKVKNAVTEVVREA